MSEQQFRLYRYKGQGYNGQDTLGIENSEAPGKVFGLGHVRDEPTTLAIERSKSRLREFRSGEKKWDPDIYLFDWKGGVEIPVDEQDWEQKYNDLVIALEAAAKKHGLCEQWDDFKSDNDVVVPKPPIPDEPVGYGTVVEFEGRVPAYRGFEGSKWRFTTTDKEFTWEELVEFCNNKPFKVLYGED